MAFKRKDIMTTNQCHHETAYQMLVESEEKERDFFEVLVYLLLILATVATIWQFGREPIRFADIGIDHLQKIATSL
ncbi:MAG: hypothetical protein ACR2G0_03080 [Chthoniobacterales bacterium]